MEAVKAAVDLELGGVHNHLVDPAISLLRGKAGADLQLRGQEIGPASCRNPVPIVGGDIQIGNADDRPRQGLGCRPVGVDLGDRLLLALLPFGHKILNEDRRYQHQQDHDADKGGLKEHAKGVPEAGFDFHG